MWSKFNDKYLVKNSMNIAIQVNGKLRASIEVDINIDKDDLLKECYSNSNVNKYVADSTIIKEIYVPNKLVNIVIKH